MELADKHFKWSRLSLQRANVFSLGTPFEVAQWKVQ